MKDWKKILLKPTDTLETAIKVLHVGGMRIALVATEKYELLGTITDGDIRRALLKHMGMDSLVTDVMNNTPITVSKFESPEEIMSLMQKKGLLHVPIVDDKNCLVALEILELLIGSAQHDNPVFLMAGGFGKRLSPLTNDTPKPLLRVGPKPILETILDQFIESGFHDFYISF